MTPVGQLRKNFEEMEINVEEAVLGEDRQEGRSLSMRKKLYRHKKTNSEIENLTDKLEDDDENGDKNDEN